MTVRCADSRSGSARTAAIDPFDREFRRWSTSRMAAPVAMTSVRAALADRPDVAVELSAELGSDSEVAKTLEAEVKELHT